MSKPEHYSRLERMYLAAPVNRIYPTAIDVQEGQATLTLAVDEAFHHSAHAVHGSVYFKLLDDAAFFAAASLEPEMFVLTTSFTTYLTRPVVSGTMKAVGRVVNQTRSQFIAEAVVYDAEDRELGRGNGVFVRGRLRLADALGYGD